MANSELTIYLIALPSGIEESDFEKVMLEDVFPALSNRGPTRRGQVNMLYLFKGSIQGQTRYVWMVRGMMYGVGHEKEVMEKLGALGVSIAGGSMDELREVGRWMRDEGQ